MRRVSIPFYIIECAINDGWDNSLRFFITLKSLYNSGTIYCATYRNISAKTRYSIGSCSKHVKILIDKGLIRRHGKNISCVSTYRLSESLKSHGKPSMVSRVEVTERKNQKAYIVLSLLRNNIRQQEYKRKIKSDWKNLQNQVENRSYMDPGDYKLFRKLDKKLSNSEKASNLMHIGISNRGLGLLANRSQSTGKAYKDKLKSLGEIKTKRVFQKVATMSKREFNLYRSYSSLDGSHVHFRGCMYKELYSRVEIKEADPRSFRVEACK